MPPTTDYYAREAALAAYSPLHFVTPPEMASAVWEILARLGPEDALYAVQQKSSSDGLATSGPDWKIERSKIEPSRLYYKDQAEAARLAAIVESDSQESAILRDLQKSRYLCAQPAFALALCVKGHREHQRKACTPSYVEHLKCSVKLARAVDIHCRPQFVDYSACLNGAAGDAGKCVKQLQAFDVCTEGW